MWVTNTDSAIDEKCITNAGLDALQQALENKGYAVNRTKISISARYGGVWKTNGKISTISIIDKGDIRECYDHETSKGWLCKPKSGILAEIVADAEIIEENTPKKNDIKKETHTTLKSKFCSECGTKLPPNAKFCPSCGIKILKR